MILKKATTCVLLGLLMIGGHIRSQEVTDGNLNTWFLLLNHFKISDKFTITNELHERTGSFLSDQGQVLIRPSIDLNLNAQTDISLGYTFINMQSYEPYYLPISRNEHNIWEQVLLKFDVGNVQVQNRIRQEHRWVEHIESTGIDKFEINGTDFQNRFRYRFTVNFDLIKMKRDGQALFFSGFDEIWINQSDNLMPSSMARNWLYLGLGYRFDKSANIQLGFMNQYDKVGDNDFISSAILQLTLVKRFDLTSDS